MKRLFAKPFLLPIFVTAAVAAAFVLLAKWHPIEGHRAGYLEPFFSPFALGLQPLVTAALLVELAHLLVPRWRPLRSWTPEGRAKIRRRTIPLALALAAIQAVMLSRALNQGIFEMSGSQTRLLIAMWTGGFCAVFALIAIADRFGLIGGVATSMLVSTYPLFVRTARLMRDAELMFSPLMILLGLLCAATLALVLFGSRIRVRSERLSYRLPAMPISTIWLIVVGVLAVQGLVGAGFGGRELFQFLNVIYARGFTFYLIWFLSSLALALFLAADRSVASHRSRVRSRALLFAFLLSFVFLALIDWVVQTSRARYVLLDDGFVALLILVAVVRDIAREICCRFAAPERAVVAELRSVHDVDDIIDALAAQGISAHCRGVTLRSLFHIFTPWISLSITVPREQAETARKFLEGSLQNGKFHFVNKEALKEVFA